MGGVLGPPSLCGAPKSILSLDIDPYGYSRSDPCRSADPPTNATDRCPVDGQYEQRFPYHR